MKRLLLLLFLVVAARGAELDVAAMGSDLNGWKGGVARYSLSGAGFEVTRPVTRTDGNGNLIVTTVIRERKRGAPVFEATLRALVSPDGLVRTLGMEGSVEGHPFETGEITRPEPVTPAPVAGETDTEPVGSTFVDVTPIDPDEAMIESLAQGLRSAIERARSSEKVVRRDLSGWIFSSEASSSEVIAEGVDVVVRSVFRRSGSLKEP